MSMKLYCKCLNTCVEIFGDITGSKSASTFPGELSDEEIAEVEVIKISHRLSHLLKEKPIGQWRIYTCINCCLFVYASKKESNFHLVINKNLLSSPAEISEVSLSEHFSPAFKILLKQDDSITEDMYEHRLNDVAASWLREEAQRTEERIKNFADQQYAELESLRIRALKDDFIINRVITAARENHTVNDIVNQLSNEEIEPIPEIIKNKHEEIINDLGDGIIFPLDDFDHPLFAKDYCDTAQEVTDDDDDNAKFMQYRKGDAAHLARSLPIPVPQFVHDLAYDTKLNESPPVPTDIAESIKALAKSVHGDSIFGELPRPRFRNHL